jgi:hypothetical protein
MTAKMSLLPMGVRSPGEMQAALRDHTENQLMSTRLSAMDCSCAGNTRVGTDMTKLLLEKKLCGISPSSISYVSSHLASNNSILTYEEFVAQNKLSGRNAPIISLKTFYTSLFRYKFVFSPSTDGQLSHCEWEALMAGAVPVVRKFNSTIVITLNCSIPFHQFLNICLALSLF